MLSSPAALAPQMVMESDGAMRLETPEERAERRKILDTIRAYLISERFGPRLAPRLVGTTRAEQLAWMRMVEAQPLDERGRPVVRR